MGQGDTIDVINNTGNDLQPFSLKKKEEFRNYNENDQKLVVEKHYRDMRTYQTLEFVNKMYEKYNFNNGGRTQMTIRDAFYRLETYVDSSDPDLNLPNMIHMLQTSEAIRKAGHPDWFVLVGLIHDMGKIMFLVSFAISF